MEKKEYKLLDVVIELELGIRQAMRDKYTESYDTIHVYYSFNNSLFYISERPLLDNSMELLSCYYDELNEPTTFNQLINNLKEFNITFKTFSEPAVHYSLEDDMEYCY